MGAYAIVNKDGLVINSISWDPEDQPDFDYGASAGNQAVLIDGSMQAGPGFTYVDGKFIPPPPTQEELDQQKAMAINGNISLKSSLMNEATQKRDTLQDAVDMGIATELEEEALPLWKKYRVLLSRVNAETSDTVTFPEKPTIP